MALSQNLPGPPGLATCGIPVALISPVGSLLLLSWGERVPPGSESLPVHLSNKADSAWHF